jgi:hypothetical protein
MMTENDSTGKYQQNVKSSGSGTFNTFQGDTQHITVYQRAVDRYFQAGRNALKNGLYPLAVQKFEEFLTTVDDIELDERDAQDAEDAQDAPDSRAARDREENLTAAHLYAALAMLNAGPPSHRAPEEIFRITDHLERAIGTGASTERSAQAKVVLAIVTEDYYSSVGMETPGAKDEAEVLQLAVNDLGSEGANELVTALAEPEHSETWRILLKRGRELGLDVPPEPEQQQEAKIGDPGRPEAVRKFFTTTPDPVSRQAHLMFLLGALAAVVVGFAAGGFLDFVGVVAGIWLGRTAYRRFRVYQQFAKDFAAAEPKPTDEQMDEWLAGDMEYLMSRAKARVRLNTKIRKRLGDSGDLSIPVQRILGVSLPGPHDDWRARIAPGKDGSLRASRYDVLILFLTDQLISTYRAQLNFSTGAITYEGTREHHYKDVVGVSSVSVPMDREITAAVEIVTKTKAKTALSMAQQFSLEIANGKDLSIVTGYGDLASAIKATVAGDDNDRSLAVIQRMVRARHSSTALK